MIACRVLNDVMWILMWRFCILMAADQQGCRLPNCCPSAALTSLSSKHDRGSEAACSLSRWVLCSSRTEKCDFKDIKICVLFDFIASKLCVSRVSLGHHARHHGVHGVLHGHHAIAKTPLYTPRRGSVSQRRLENLITETLKLYRTSLPWRSLIFTA